jgi:hypothetical protein
MRSTAFSIKIQPGHLIEIGPISFWVKLWFGDSGRDDNCAVSVSEGVAQLQCRLDIPIRIEYNGRRFNFSS